jgi:hypothetical protein
MTGRAEIRDTSLQVVNFAPLNRRPGRDIFKAEKAKGKKR